MNFEELANKRLDAGWQAIQSASERLFTKRAELIALLTRQYEHLELTDRKLYHYSPQLALRLTSSGLVDSSLLFEPPRIPDHREGLEHGLRVLLTWLVEQERMVEAQRWAELSRTVLERSSSIDYLDRGAQGSIFCVGDSSSRYYLNVQILPRAERLKLFAELGGEALYQRVTPFTEQSEIRLGGLGLTLSGDKPRLKLYLRGKFASLKTVSQDLEDGITLEVLEAFDSSGFIRDSMQAEIAVEEDHRGGLRTKWVFFVDDPKLASATCQQWLSRVGSKNPAHEISDILGGPASLFALGAGIAEGDRQLERVNIYVRPAR